MGPDGRLVGKVAIVTGGGSGIGAATVRRFRKEAARVVVADIDLPSAEAVAAEPGPEAMAVAHDVRDEAAWQRLVAGCEAHFGGLHVLVNNAGLFEVGNIETQSEAEWDRVHAVSAKGAFLGCRAAVKAMKRGPGGAIVNVASIASLQGEPYAAAYCAAKGAVEALTRSVAVHCVRMRYPIRCNSLHPGPIDTPMVRAIPGQMAEAAARGFQPPVAQSPVESYRATAAEMARSVLFLASDDSPWVNGARLIADNAMSVMSGVSPAPLQQESCPP
jgi:3(or 17)beta-hydroxysteroid dehydrogenase